MLILTDQQVNARLTWATVLHAIREGFRCADTFRAPERLVIASPTGGTTLTMPCVDAESWYGVKKISIVPDNPSRNLPTVQAWYTLIDPYGIPKLACDATLLTRIRTAGTSALAATYLAPPKAHTLLIVGTGSLAPYLAEAHHHVHAYARVLVWGRDSDKARACAQTIQTRLPSPLVTSTDDLAAAVLEADVISVATTSREPLIRGAHLRPGQHLDLVGAFLPQMRESDSDVIKQSRVFIDGLEGAKAEAGDLIQALADGWRWEEINGDLQALVLGHTARSDAADITLFKSVGHALEDLVVAKVLLNTLPDNGQAPTDAL